MFDGISLESKASSIYQALCLPVSVTEILQANQLGTVRLDNLSKVFLLILTKKLNVVEGSEVLCSRLQARRAI